MSSFHCRCNLHEKDCIYPNCTSGQYDQNAAPMPEPDMMDQQAYVFAHSTDQMRIYGEQCRAAGYAAGVTDGAKQMFDALQFAAANTSDTEWDDRLCEYSESALESVSPEAHAEWKTIERVAKGSHQQGYAAGVAACQDALADACCDAEIPDSKYESLMIALRGEVKP